MNTLEKDEHTS